MFSLRCGTMGGFFLTSLLLLCLQLKARASVCPYGWKDFPGSQSCYLIMDHQTRFNFDRAANQCFVHQAELFSPDDMTEVNWLDKEIQQISSAGLPPKMSWWLGLEDKGKGQGLQYLNGSRLPPDLVTWLQNMVPKPATSRRCASLVNSTVSLSGCGSWYGLICERSKALHPTCDVDNAWVYINGSCFKYFTDQQSWYLAKSTCEKYEGSLAKITTQEQLSFIWNQAKTATSVSWIGLKSDVRPKIFTWTDGSALPYQGESFSWWSSDQFRESLVSVLLSKHSDPDICGLINSNGTQLLSSWMTQACNQKNSFTCSKPPGVCADGWIPHQEICIIFYPQFKVSWSSARQFCQDLGGDVIVIPSQSYQEVVNKYLAEQKDEDMDSFWLGLKDTDNNTFEWVDSHYSFNWSNWAGEFKNEPLLMEVAHISTEDRTGKWQVTSDPSQLRGLACFISGTKKVTERRFPWRSVKCPDQWEVAGDSCVYLSRDTVSWSQASSSCQNLQAQLLVVGSADVQDFLNNRVTVGQFWIGLSDRLKEGTFVWVNGSKLDFTSWAPNQPENGEDKNCVLVKATASSARWYDQTCQEKLPYICQKQPAGNLSEVGVPPVNATEGTYSALCGSMWELGASSNFCYQFRESRLSWADALELCESMNGSLASIGSREEERYMQDRLVSLDANLFWIGASDRRREASWEWEDNSPFAYLNWYPGQPNGLTKENCGLVHDNSMLWHDYPCSSRYGFICKKTAASEQTESVTESTTSRILSDGQYYGCPLGWLPYDTSCYLLRREQSTWLDGQASCRNEGAALASVGSDFENKFIWSQLPKESCRNSHSDDHQCQVWADDMECQKNPSWMSLNCRMSCSLCDHPCINKHTHHECVLWASVGECLKNPNFMWPNCALSCGCDTSINEGFWIGLNDMQSEKTFTWRNLSPVTFTDWLPNEPNNYRGENEDCVKIHTTNGEWSDELCDQVNAGYICQKKMAVMDTSTLSPDNIGCPHQGFAYQASCFVIVDTPKTWQGARDYCSLQNATLITIPDGVVGAFIVSELIHKSSSYWIGLSARAGRYEWNSGSHIDYLPWSPTHTGNENNSCVAIRTQKPVGLWEDLDCQSLQPFLCETARSVFTEPTLPTETTTLAQCPSTWQGSREQCYKMFFNSKSWFAAEKDCETYGGSLASVHGDETSDLILSLTGWNLADGVWIGLTDQFVESRYEWSDGSPFDFSKWAKGEPNSATTTEDCVQVLPVTMEWNDINCYLTRTYVCSISRGFPFPSPTFTATSISEAMTCQESDWLYHGRFCYWISPDYGSNSYLSWFAAQRQCQSQGGDFASITSQDENNFLITQLSSRSTTLFWIGLNQLQQSSYVWTDGQPESFVAWGPNEPNNFFGGERCVTISGVVGAWQDNECMKEYGYVCKKSNQSTSLEPTVTPSVYDGVCPDGFIGSGLSPKCYYLGGRGNTGSDDPPQDWISARDFCRNMTASKRVDIASLHSWIEQVFVTSLMWEVNRNLWIGFNDRAKANQYSWQDNSEVTYTNWAARKPARLFYRSLDNYNCVEMLRNPHDTKDTAKWNDSPCSKRNAFLCQTLQAPVSAPTSPMTTTTVPSSCPAPFFMFKSSCYWVVSQPQPWTEARNFCQSHHADLASTSDIFEVARLDVARLNSGITGSVWIGLKYDESTSQYTWSNGWPVVETFWSIGNPDSQNNDSCVLFSEASWNDSSCSESLPFICEIKPGPPPTSPPQHDLGCSAANQVQFGDSCYLLEPWHQVSWPEASFKCGQLGMDLVSVHSQAENDFLRNHLERVTPPGFQWADLMPSVWLGLNRHLQGGFRWSDDSPVSYFNWDAGQPTSVSSEESCVLMSWQSGQWSDQSCLDYRLGYICKTRKNSLSDLSSTSEHKVNSISTAAFTSPSQQIVSETARSLTPWPAESRDSSHVATSERSLGTVGNILSQGQIAGIVSGVVAFLLIITALIIYKNRTRLFQYGGVDKVAPPVTGYDNVLYNHYQVGQPQQVTEDVTTQHSVDTTVH